MLAFDHFLLAMTISLQLSAYSEQTKLWPTVGNHFLAHRPSEGIITLYQAYKPEIARPAVQEQRLNASSEFKLGRMTWAKPSFLWMMYRSGWASKRDQQCILAIKFEPRGFSMFSVGMQRSVQSGKQGVARLWTSGIRTMDGTEVGAVAERYRLRCAAAWLSSWRQE